MRLIAVLLLSLITAYWAVFAIFLLFLPEGSTGATVFVLLGAARLLGAGIYALVTWGTAKRSRPLHIAAIVVSALGTLLFLTGVPIQADILVAWVGLADMAVLTWLSVLVAAANLVAVALLSLTIPKAKTRN